MFLISTVLLLFSAGAIAKSDGGEHDAADGPLNLTPLIQRGEASRARELSSVDPTLFAGVPSHAAFITVNETNKWNTFFWFFPVQNKPLDSTPWIIWLQGRDGTSSLFGLFLEFGPIQLINNTVSRRSVTWGSDYSILFIDNPDETGFSYSGSDTYMKDEDDLGRSLLSFIHQFVQVFPELQKAPLFIAGESSAGYFIPVLGHYLHNYQNKSTPVNLKGLVIGDGIIDPPSTLHYSELLLQLGYLEQEEATKMKAIEDAARKAWEKGDAKTYYKLRYKVTHIVFRIISNLHDFTKDYEDIEFFPFEPFLSNMEIRRALHVGMVPFISYTMWNIVRDERITFKPWLEELLEHCGVLCYNGQLTFWTSYAVSVHAYRSFKWSGSEAYLRAPRIDIPSPFQIGMLYPVGYVKAAGNFMEVMIRSAGLSAPTDQPLGTKHVLNMFVNKFK